MPQLLFISTGPSQLPAWPGGRGRHREDLDQEGPDRRESDAWPRGLNTKQRDHVPRARLQRWRSQPSTALGMVWGVGVGVRMAGAGARADRTSETPLLAPVPGRGGEGFEAGEGEGIGRRRTLLTSHRPARPSLASSSRSHSSARLLHNSFPGHTPGTRTSPAATGPTVAHYERGKTAREWSMRTSRGKPAASVLSS